MQQKVEKDFYDVCFKESSIVFVVLEFLTKFSIPRYYTSKYLKIKYMYKRFYDGLWESEKIISCVKHLWF